MCLCGNVTRITTDDLTYLHCDDCGTDWDFISISHEQKIVNHQKTMERIRDEVAHTCDGPLTPFVHMYRVLDMVYTNKITAEEGANYLSESNLLNEENDEIPSSEY
jgi:hypothetical protein